MAALAERVLLEGREFQTNLTESLSYYILICMLFIINTHH